MQYIPYKIREPLTNRIGTVYTQMALSSVHQMIRRCDITVIILLSLMG